MSELWFDLEFGHIPQTSKSISLTTEILSGQLISLHLERLEGRIISAGAVAGVNYAMDESVLSLNINGEAVGGTLMLPMGADIQLADLVMWKTQLVNSI